MQAALRLAPALLAPMWRHLAALTSPLTLPTIYRAGSESGNTRLRLLALAFTVQHVTQLHGFLVTLPRGDVEMVLGHDWLEVGGLHLHLHLHWSNRSLQLKAPLSVCN